MANVDEEFLKFLEERNRAELKKLVEKPQFIFILEERPITTVKAVNMLQDDHTGVLLLSTKMPKELGEFERLDLYYYLCEDIPSDSALKKVALLFGNFNVIARRILDFSGHYEKAIIVFGDIESMLKHRKAQDIEKLLNILYENIAVKNIKIFVPIKPDTLTEETGFTPRMFGRLERSLGAVVIGEK
ncbi:TPA: hypothetical protein H1016_05705 [archaeon]|uniref:Uncharacterized protein n=1 Tax=Candidatus Naiadarchaeum limnaeum TaxID=2756139 RepID=A0A832XH43_9ARCH|nr:hypothetical protein [Candidatus Naiadarchaeum limnaeum]